MQIGSLVKSKNGRDKDKCYIVVRLVDNRIVLLVDGITRKLQNPKKKNIKHLKEMTLITNIKEKIENEKQVFDKEINKAINTYIQSLENNLE